MSIICFERDTFGIQRILNNLVNGNNNQRNFLCRSSVLRTRLALVNSSDSICRKKLNLERTLQENPFLNNVFHKSLNHDQITGQLVNRDDFILMMLSLFLNKQKDLAIVPQFSTSEIKLVDPLASLASVLVGLDQCAFNVRVPGSLSSDEAAAEMVELYAQAVSRDSPFINYATDPTILAVLPFMNDNDVLINLPDYAPTGIITAKTIFRAKFAGCLVGPHISQLLLLNVPMGALTVEQKYGTYPDKVFAIANNIVVEWGRNRTEMIAIQNGKISTLPPQPTFAQLINRYVYSGRALAEVVHNDPVIQFYYHACLILTELGCGVNPGFPVYPNQISYVTEGGVANLKSILGEVADLALTHVWYWKWQVYERLRPEAFSLWVDNILQGIKSNNGNYNISNVLLNNGILNLNQAYNALWGVGFTNSFTLSTTYREGSPAHPAYPSGHAVVAGACATILKIFLDTDKLWSSLPGLQVGNLNRRVVPITVNTPFAESNSTGTALVDYTDSDNVNMTIYGEINKLASNSGMGRDWAAVHYRKDISSGILLGEHVAVEFMKDKLSSYVQNNLNGTVPRIKFRKFDGTLAEISPRVKSSC